MNYGDLKSHFNDLLNRSDITAALTTRFIDQGIARIQRQLRTPLNEKKKDYTLTGATTQLTLPNDFLEIISLYANEYELQRITMKKYRELANSAYEGKPLIYHQAHLFSLTNALSKCVVIIDALQSSYQCQNRHVAGPGLSSFGCLPFFLGV